MQFKAEKTAQFIIEKVAPYFNRHGYTGTSMSEICKLTGLTKGAIYGNFKDKDDLLNQVFNYMLQQTLGDISAHVERQDSAIDKLIAFTLFYRGYFDKVWEFGGCPLLNLGVDTLNHHPMHKRVREEIDKLIVTLRQVIEQGQDEGSIIASIDADSFAKRIYAQIQGSIFMAFMLDEKEPIISMMDHIDHTIASELMV